MNKGTFPEKDQGLLRQTLIGQNLVNQTTQFLSDNSEFGLLMLRNRVFPTVKFGDQFLDGCQEETLVLAGLIIFYKNQFLEEAFLRLATVVKEV